MAPWVWSSRPVGLRFHLWKRGLPFERVESPHEKAESHRHVMADEIVGIDLGTTNSLIGVMEAGFPILIAGANGSRLTPSVVHFPENGEPLVGASADRMRPIGP